jgi:TusA-related sulfurtransferase
VKIATKMLPLKPGTIIEAKADCETFEKDVRGICERWKKVLLSVKQQGKVKTVQIQV